MSNPLDPASTEARLPSEKPIAPEAAGEVEQRDEIDESLRERLLEIVQVGMPVLRERAHQLSPEQIRSPELGRLIEAMRETMRHAPGVGLAAPQIGLPLQLAVIEDPEEYQRGMPPEQLAAQERQVVPFHVIINPRLEVVGDETVDYFEGCLSVTDFMALVRRARRVRVTALDEHGGPLTIDASGWYARILQHEIDHLHGTVYVDRMETRTFMTVTNHARLWRGKSVAETRRLLLRDE